MIRVGQHIVIDDVAVKETFIRASGPGGQNVNKVASAVQLCVDMKKAAASCPAIDAEFLSRLRRVAGRRMTAGGQITIEARRFRTQERNREDAHRRLVDLISRALIAPKTRKKTRPGKAARIRRLEGKKHRGAIKSLRQPPKRGET